MKTTLKTLGMIAAIAFTATACDDTATGPETTDPNFVRGGLPQNTLPTIVDIVQTDDGEFDVLETLVVRSGLAGALSGNRPYTVFAPQDAAFGRLFDLLEVPGMTPEEQAENACPEATGCPDFVVETLLYHVVNGRRYSESVVGDRQIRTQLGDFFTMDGATIITTCEADNDSDIIAAVPGETFDIPAKNGVIHVVTEVLLPKQVCDAVL
ncbi:MAG: fasciclin domain-containing protein [marine benthic group bacterium]|jgi:transforming growth factor-beta-induced protein|nr:fasciclin domain-containing protein [Gemmatimonadota bacterium]MCL7963017.1 fasciclin domain-containing protein [Candidatus Carthagonibacter metallireducens]MCL7938032.1 fasciclin domain-containing protein [Gemmatimonadota bacterium]MCL7965875.1 fasciclin domain-containing protein [Gemmatimonadota bacterium]MCL7970365.1 fasciclin domain-containing protein [Gemmatimonadota bacterium]